MASLISRRFSNSWFKSWRPSSLYSSSLPSTTISKPSPQSYLHHASSNHILKPQILETTFIRSAPLAIFRRSNPAFSPAIGSSSKSYNREIRYLSQIPGFNPDWFLENEIRESLKRSINNIKGLKTALAVQIVVELGFATWVAYINPFPRVEEFVQVFAVSAVQLGLVLLMRHTLRKMNPSDMETGEGLLRQTREANLAFESMIAGTILLVVACSGTTFCGLKALARIRCHEFSALLSIVMLLPLFFSLELLRLEQKLGRLTPELPIPMKDWG